MSRWSSISKLSSLATVMVSIFLSSCSDSSGSIDTGAGYIVPYITVQPEVITAVDAPEQTILTDIPDEEMLSLRITDQSGNYTHTWNPITTYSPSEPLHPGTYTVEAFYGDINNEGFDEPYFYGQSTVEVTHNQTSETSLLCSLANTLIEVTTNDSFRNFFKDYIIMLHSEGGNYISIRSGEKRTAYLKSGNISIGLDLTMPDGKRLMFNPASIQNALPRYFYNLSFGLTLSDNGTPQLSISFDEKTAADDVLISLTKEFIDIKGPTLTPIGFSSDSILHLSEGNIPDNPLQIAASSLGAPLKNLNLTTLSSSLIARGWPEEVNLLSMDEATGAILSELGLQITDLNTLRSVGGVIDFTQIAAHLRYDEQSPENRFILEAIDEDSKISSPLCLRIMTEPVDLRVISLSNAVIGINEAEAIIEAPSARLEDNMEIQLINELTNTWESADIISISEIGASKYAVRFAVPDGTTNLKWRILYCGSIRDEQTLKRVAPNFAMEYDAYAMKIAFKVNAQDSRLTSIVSSHLRVYAGKQLVPPIERDTEKGIVVIGGLEPGTNYTFRFTLSDDPSEADFTAPISIRTERTSNVPNGSFEDITLSIDYKDMLSGGRYSQDYIEIFNMQNRSTFALSTPKEWANTNVKTFCKDASNHNTWYLEPSVYTVNQSADQAYGVKLTSVAWDIAGEEIPDYLQESVPFVKYSRNVPHISYRAAGKLFLGKYRFDPTTLTETYDEGVAINSRPSALNGYYAYRPGENSQSDKGLVNVEVIGKVGSEEVTIARSTALLNPVHTFTAFSVPITYERFGVKASKIKILFSSSADTGSIEYETQHISTTPSLPTSTSTGSELLIDNLTFSY